MKCEYCGEEDYYGQHVCRSEVVSKDVEIHSLESKLNNAERIITRLELEKAKLYDRCLRCEEVMYEAVINGNDNELIDHVNEGIGKI